MGFAKEERPRPFADGWKHKDRSELTIPEKVILSRKVLNPSEKEYAYPKPTGKVPVFLEWGQHLQLFPLIVIPVAARWLFMKLTGWNAHPVIVYVLTIAFNSRFTQHYLQRLRDYAQTHGYLDGDVPRDTVPESMTGKLYVELLNGALGRPLLFMLLAYDRRAVPQLDWWLPLQLGVFTIIADFIYYWAHRATHEVPWLWKHHARHHTTKHPSAYLLGFADEPQEVFDSYVTPILTYLVYPLNYDALYIWAMYFVSVEIMGHAGIRAYYPAVLIVIEDHDLHHRNGWQRSYNYGKQSMLWDTLFGTVGERLETGKENIDWNNHLH